jgi:hypothetical protein
LEDKKALKPIEVTESGIIKSFLLMLIPSKACWPIVSKELPQSKTSIGQL